MCTCFFRCSWKLHFLCSGVSNWISPIADQWTWIWSFPCRAPGESSDSLWQKVRHDVLSQTQTETEIGTRSSQAPEQIVELGWECSLNHLPAFVIVPYYRPYFSIGSLRAVSTYFFSFLMPHSAVWGIVMLMSGSSRFCLIKARL